MIGKIGYFVTNIANEKIKIMQNMLENHTQLNFPELKVPAYYVFTNEELNKIVELKPKSIEELKKINILIPFKIKVHCECIVNEIIK